MAWTIEEALTCLQSVSLAIAQRDPDLSSDTPQINPGATNSEIDLLEKYWGIRLPPSYANLLKAANGMTYFWYDNPLLSTQEIIEDTFETETFEEPFPKLYRYIFSCGTEDYDAFAFDPSQVSSDGELSVVALNDEGEAGRWSSFEVFLKIYLRWVNASLKDENANLFQNW